MRLDPYILLTRLREHPLPSKAAIESDIKRLTLIGDHSFDAFSLGSADPFLAAIVGRAGEGPWVLRTATLPPSDMACEELPFTIASLFADCVDGNGFIDTTVVEKRWGAKAVALLQQVDAVGSRPPQFPIGDLTALEIQLRHRDSRLLDLHAKAVGVPESMPVLESCVDNLQGAQPFKDVNCVLVQHLLGQQIPMFDAFEAAGLSPKNTFVVGRGYSDSGVVRALGEERGYHMFAKAKPAVGGYEQATRAQIRQALVSAIARAKTNGKPILLLDDGGLAIRLVHEEFGKYAHLFRCVEQTSHGVTEIEKIKTLVAPVVNVARSRGKHREAPFIAEEAVHRLLIDLKALGREDLKGREVTVIGYGFIGFEMARQLKELGAIVTVVETDSALAEQAFKDGFNIAKSEADGYARASIVVGCTGHRSIGPEQLDLLKDGALLVSCSSAEVEIDTVLLAASGSYRELPHRGDYQSNHRNLEFNYNGKRIAVLNEGKPINFDGNVNSVAPEKIQLTASLLFEAAVQAMDNPAAGLHDLNDAAQDRVLAAFEPLLAKWQTRMEEERAKPHGVSRDAFPTIQIPDAQPKPCRSDPGQIYRLALQCSDAVVNNDYALIPNYPGVGEALLVDRKGLGQFVLPGLSGTVVDFQTIGTSIVVVTRDAEGRRIQHVFDMPPELLTDQAMVTCSAVARHRMRSAQDNLVAFCTAREVNPDTNYAVRNVMLQQSKKGVAFFDLCNGEQGLVAGLTKTAGHKVSALGNRHTVIDYDDNCLYVLTPDCQRCVRKIDLNSIGVSAHRIFGGHQDSSDMWIASDVGSDGSVELIRLDISLEQVLNRVRIPLPPGSQLYGAETKTCWESIDTASYRSFAALVLRYFDSADEPLPENIKGMQGELNHSIPRPIGVDMGYAPTGKRTPDRPTYMKVEEPDWMWQRIETEAIAAPTKWDDQEPQQRLQLNNGRALEVFDTVTPYGGETTRLRVTGAANPQASKPVLMRSSVKLEQVSEGVVVIGDGDYQYPIAAKDLGEEPLEALLASRKLENVRVFAASPTAFYAVRKGHIVRIDKQSGELHPSPDVFGFDKPAEGGEVLVDPQTGTVLVVDQRDNTIALLDPNNLDSLGHIKVPGDAKPTGIHVDREGRLVVTANIGLFDHRQFLLDVPHHRLGGIRAEPQAEIQPIQADTMKAAVLELDLQTLHEKVREPLARLVLEGESQVRMEKLMQNPQGYDTPTGERIWLQFVNSDESIDSGIGVNQPQYLRFVQILSDLWSGQESSNRQRAAVRFGLDLLQSVLEDMASANPRHIQELNGNYSTRFEMALIAAGDAALPTLEEAWGLSHDGVPVPHMGDEVIYGPNLLRLALELGGPKTKALVIDILAETLRTTRLVWSTQNGPGEIEPRPLWSMMCNAAKIVKRTAAVFPELHTHWQRLLNTFPKTNELETRCWRDLKAKGPGEQ